MRSIPPPPSSAVRCKATRKNSSPTSVANFACSDPTPTPSPIPSGKDAPDLDGPAPRSASFRNHHMDPPGSLGPVTPPPPGDARPRPKTVSFAPEETKVAPPKRVSFAPEVEEAEEEEEEEDCAADERDVANAPRHHRRHRQQQQQDPQMAMPQGYAYAVAPPDPTTMVPMPPNSRLLLHQHQHPGFDSRFHDLHHAHHAHRAHHAQPPSVLNDTETYATPDSCDHSHEHTGGGGGGGGGTRIKIPCIDLGKLTKRVFAAALDYGDEACRADPDRSAVVADPNDDVGASNPHLLPPHALRDPAKALEIMDELIGMLKEQEEDAANDAAGGGEGEGEESDGTERNEADSEDESSSSRGLRSHGDADEPKADSDRPKEGERASEGAGGPSEPVETSEPDETNAADEPRSSRAGSADKGDNSAPGPKCYVTVVDGADAHASHDDSLCSDVEGRASLTVETFLGLDKLDDLLTLLKYKDCWSADEVSNLLKLLKVERSSSGGGGSGRTDALINFLKFKELWPAEELLDLFKFFCFPERFDVEEDADDEEEGADGAAAEATAASAPPTKGADPEETEKERADLEGKEEGKVTSSSPVSDEEGKRADRRLRTGEDDASPASPELDRLNESAISNDSQFEDTLDLLEFDPAPADSEAQAPPPREEVPARGGDARSVADKLKHALGIGGEATSDQACVAELNCISESNIVGVSQELQIDSIAGGEFLLDDDDDANAPRPDGTDGSEPRQKVFRFYTPSDNYLDGVRKINPMVKGAAQDIWRETWKDARPPVSGVGGSPDARVAEPPEDGGSAPASGDVSADGSGGGDTIRSGRNLKIKDAALIAMRRRRKNTAPPGDARGRKGDCADGSKELSEDGNGSSLESSVSADLDRFDVDGGQKLKSPFDGASEGHLRNEDAPAQAIDDAVVDVDHDGIKEATRSVMRELELSVDFDWGEMPPSKGADADVTLPLSWCGLESTASAREERREGRKEDGLDRVTRGVLAKVGDGDVSAEREMTVKEAVSRALHELGKDSELSRIMHVLDLNSSTCDDGTEARDRRGGEGDGKKGPRELPPPTATTTLPVTGWLVEVEDNEAMYYTKYGPLDSKGRLVVD